MEIRTLRYFAEMAKLENMSRAAEYLHISQPSLSRAMKDLEEEMGKKLFERHSHSISLTEEGMLLRKRAEDILELVDKTAQEFRTMDDVIGGDVYIGCAESAGMSCFMRAAAVVRHKYPRMRFHFYSSDIGPVGERLDKGLLDMAVICHPVDEG